MQVLKPRAHHSDSRERPRCSVSKGEFLIMHIGQVNS